jgi:glycosyltransferase involved in cell wall biosynthesis
MTDEASASSSPIDPSLRVAVVHDWLTGMRGGEAVLEAILDSLPGAELFTLFHFPGSVSEKIESRTIHTSRLQAAAHRVRDYRTLLPAFPHAARQWDLSSYDLIVSSSHCVAKGVRSVGKPHLSYCHTPMRYVWDRFDDYFPRSRPLRRAAAMSVAPWLRKWDVSTSREVTRFVANSSFVRDRIRRFYERDAEVIHPFVDDVFLDAPLTGTRGDYHVVLSALVPYKRVDLAIDAAVRTGRRLVILGGGPLEAALRRGTPPNVEIAGSVSRAEIMKVVGGARSLILPGVEDFGITPLEAMALGTPVVALGEGGVLDSVVEGQTGIFFRQPAVDSLCRALDEVERQEWSRDVLRARAAGFTRTHFRQRFGSALQQVLR